MAKFLLNLSIFLQRKKWLKPYKYWAFARGYATSEKV